MTDQCLATRPTGEPGVFDPDTGVVTPPAPQVVHGPDLPPWDGCCKVKTQVGAPVATVIVPAEVTLRKGDRVTIIAAGDTALVGRTLAVTSDHFGTHVTSHRHSAEFLA
jgi:hypothetical protein